MKVVILAGGYGTRLAGYTKSIPKPMVKIGKLPILIHIMKLYLNYGYKDFYIALGYKNKVVKKFFKKFKKLNKKFVYYLNGSKCNVTLIYTGHNTFTGGRLKRLKNFFKPKENFMLTYGDGISNVNLKKLEIFHKKNKKLATVTAVRPPARFGEIVLKKNKVSSFKEKPQVGDGWINGGFFVLNQKFLNFIKNDNTVLEKEPLEKASNLGQLYAYKHNGFWKCMDVKRDKDVLEEIYKKNKFKWAKK
mgnify:CR=1 FL=1|tara:strand:- start:2693 stop:3433 length:741 start_codon:yes stop_codon:yes gene_type:complete